MSFRCAITCNYWAFIHRSEDPGVKKQTGWNGHVDRVGPVVDLYRVSRLSSGQHRVFFEFDRATRSNLLHLV